MACKRVSAFGALAFFIEFILESVVVGSAS